MYKDKHTFAVYLENLSGLVAGFKVDQDIEILNRSLYQRLTRVLKLRTNDQVVLFDKKINVKLELVLQNGKKICGKISQIQQNKPLKPEIIFVPCLLKKSSFESAIYTAAQMGINVIKPILTEKVRKKWWKENETGRLEKIMVSACEQSKNYWLPRFEQPVLLESFLKNLDSGIKKIFFDRDGQPLFSLLQELSDEQPQHLMLLFGPEGGLTEKELALLKSHGFKFICLTPTILRSVEAVALGLGVIRSVAS